MTPSQGARAVARAAAIGWAAVLICLSAVGAGDAADTIQDLAIDFRMNPVDGPAPAFTLSTLDGKRLSLADFRGHVVLLYFWASW